MGFPNLVKLLISVILLYVPSLVCSTGNSTVTTTSVQTTPYATVNSIVALTLTEEMDYRYNLTEIPNIYDWNLTKIALILNETNPTYLYTGITTSIMLEFLPPYLLEHLPYSVLAYHGLCQYLPSNYSGSNCSQTANVTATLCVGPLQFSNIDNPVKHTAINLTQTHNLTLADCGLKCSSGYLVYGLSSNEQHALNICKALGSTLCFVIIIFLIYNQYNDQRTSHASFWDKPLLHHCPYFITGSSFLVIFTMTVGYMDPNILCNSDGSFTFWNPKSGDGSCTAHSLFFYSGLMLYEGYTMLMAFTIFRQFYAPLNPLWNIPSRYFHLTIVSIVIVYDIATLASNAIDAVQPMGVCLPGQSNRTDLLFYILLPLLFSATVSCGCLIWTYLLLDQTIAVNKHATTVKNASSNMQDLSKRLALYGVGVTCTLLLLTITAIIFYQKQDGITQSFQTYVYCEIINYYDSQFGKGITCTRTETMPVFWFITWIISSVTAVVAQLILSCHVSNRDRFKRVATNVGTQMKDAIDKIEVSHISSQNKNRKITEFPKDQIPEHSPRDGPTTPQSFPENTQKETVNTANSKLVVSTSNIMVSTKIEVEMETSNIASTN